MSANHGTTYCYDLGCRRPECTRAKADAFADLKARRRRRRRLVNGRLVAPPDRPEGPFDHGLHTTYRNWDCRCEPCSKAALDHQRQARARQRYNQRIAQQWIQQRLFDAPARWPAALPTTLEN